MRGRVYDPLAARFLTQDPVRSAPYWTQGQNPYSYVFNDRINATDPSGFIADNWDSTAGIEGWGLGVTAASAGANFGGMLLGGGANVVTSLGIDWLMGDPFAGSGSRSATGAIGQHVANVKGGGNGGAESGGASGSDGRGTSSVPVKRARPMRLREPASPLGRSPTARPGKSLCAARQVGCKEMGDIIVAAGPQRYRGLVEELAKDKGLVPGKKADQWFDPVTGKERLRLDQGHVESSLPNTLRRGMSESADVVSLSHAEITLCIEQERSIHIKAATNYGDPVELSVEEAKELVTHLLRLIAELQ